MFSIDFDAKIDSYFDSAKQFSDYLTEIIVENAKMSSFCFFQSELLVMLYILLVGQIILI